jgi:hypothetical protein
VHVQAQAAELQILGGYLVHLSLITVRFSPSGFLVVPAHPQWYGQAGVCAEPNQNEPRFQFWILKGSD